MFPIYTKSDQRSGRRTLLHLEFSLRLLRTLKVKGPRSIHWLNSLLNCQTGFIWRKISG